MSTGFPFFIRKNHFFKCGIFAMLSCVRHYFCSDLIREDVKLSSDVGRSDPKFVTHLRKSEER